MLGADLPENYPDDDAQALNAELAAHSFWALGEQSVHGSRDVTEGYPEPLHVGDKMGIRPNGRGKNSRRLNVIAAQIGCHPLRQFKKLLKNQ